MRETIRRIIKEETSKKDLSPIIRRVLEISFLPKYKDIICGVEIVPPGSEEWDNAYKITTTFIGGYGTKYWPVTQSVSTKYDKIVDEMWDIVYDYFGEPIAIFKKFVKKCDEDIDES